jgi:hypothetical protein
LLFGCVLARLRLRALRLFLPVVWGAPLRPLKTKEILLNALLAP